MDIRDGIEPIIEKFGMKKNKVAQKAGLTPQQLCDVINKRRKLEANEFLAICNALRTTPSEIMSIKK